MHPRILSHCVSRSVREKHRVFVGVTARVPRGSRRSRESYWSWTHLSTSFVYGARGRHAFTEDYSDGYRHTTRSAAQYRPDGSAPTCLAEVGHGGCLGCSESRVSYSGLRGICLFSMLRQPRPSFLMDISRPPHSWPQQSGLGCTSGSWSSDPNRDWSFRPVPDPFCIKSPRFCHLFFS